MRFDRRDIAGSHRRDILRLMRKHGLIQTQVALVAGVQRQRFGRFLRGGENPSLEYLQRVHDAIEELSG